MKNKFLIQIMNGLFITICAVSLMCCFSNKVLAEEKSDFNDGDFKYYILSDTTAELTEYKGNDKEVVVPDEVKGYYITEIGDRAFADNNTLESVKLGKNIVRIGNSAFARNYALQKVDNTKCTKIERVEYGAFLETRVYENDVEGGLVYVGNVCLGRAEGNNDKYITIRQGTRVIADYAFNEDNRIETLELPESVQYIGLSCFYNSRKMYEVNIPYNMKEIDVYAFYNNRSLDEITGNIQYVNKNISPFVNTSFYSKYLIKKTGVSIITLIFAIVVLCGGIECGKRLLSNCIYRNITKRREDR